MTSRIIVNNIQSDTGIATVTFNSNISVNGAVSSTGISTFSNGIVVSAGSTSAPSITPSGDSNTGIFFPSADTVCIGEGGVEVIRVDSSGRVGVGTNRLSRPFEVWAGTAGTSFSVDSSGVVTKPFHPFVGVTKTNGNPTGTNTLIIFNTVDANVGNYYNTTTGLFTCPVAGSYRITIHGHTEASTGNHGLSPLKNGVLQNGGSYSAFGSATYVSHISDTILSCAANDTLSARNRYGTFWGGGSEGVTMTIQLLG